jgi:rubrerythrin
MAAGKHGEALLKLQKKLQQDEKKKQSDKVQNIGKINSNVQNLKNQLVQAMRSREEMQEKITKAGDKIDELSLKLHRAEKEQEEFYERALRNKKEQKSKDIDEDG